MEKNKSLENICKASAGILGAVSLISIASSSLPLGYFALKKIENIPLKSLVVFGIAMGGCLFYLAGAFLATYGVNKIYNLTENKEKEELYNFLKNYRKITV